MVRPPTTTRDLPLVVQLAGLEAAHAGGRGIVTTDELVWTQEVAPAPWSDSYEILLYYKLGGTPHVHVITPKLRSRLDPTTPLEHVHTHNRLCLHLPDEFDGGMRLVDSIIPWTVQGLHHYEVWAVTGNWTGGGVHPEPSASGPGPSRRIRRLRTRQAHATRRTSRERFEQAFSAIFPWRPLEDALNWK